MEACGCVDFTLDYSIWCEHMRTFPRAFPDFPLLDCTKPFAA